MSLSQISGFFYFRAYITWLHVLIYLSNATEHHGFVAQTIAKYLIWPWCTETMRKFSWTYWWMGEEVWCHNIGSELYSEVETIAEQTKEYNLRTPRVDHHWLTKQTEDWHGSVWEELHRPGGRQSPKTEGWNKHIVGDAFHSKALPVASLPVTVMAVYTITCLETISSQGLRSRPTLNDQVRYNQGLIFEYILPRELCRSILPERVENTVGSSVFVTSDTAGRCVQQTTRWPNMVCNEARRQWQSRGSRYFYPDVSSMKCVEGNTPWTRFLIWINGQTSHKT